MNDLAIVGSANMDIASFDLNFGSMLMVYSKKIAHQLADVFENDLKASVQINAKDWLNEPKYLTPVEKVVATSIALYGNVASITNIITPT